MRASKRSGDGARRGPDPASIPPEDLERLYAQCHPDPHALLGIHVSPAGVVIRCYRPDALDLRIQPEGEPAAAMRRLGDAGLFVLLLPDRKAAFPYRIEIRARDGATRLEHDPYAFLPTLGALDLHLAGEGRHELLYQKLGAHVGDIAGVAGTGFAVWAPDAQGVSVVGDFNDWDGRRHAMRRLGQSGIWELFVPDLGPGALYKYQIQPRAGGSLLKTDPYAFAMEHPPGTASKVYRASHQFRDQDWLVERDRSNPLRQPVSIYEVHTGSWQTQEGGQRPLDWRELATRLGDYVSAMGFTHVELMPVMEHPFGGSWGYQVSGYFAPTARHGSPDDFRWMVDHLHQRGIGVLIDWVPAHFPKDDFALGRFDGSALYEHIDPRQGEHPDWGTFVFNYGRAEVRNFLLASALYWLDESHADGLRLDAVASMLYLDYSRKHGEWVANVHGGRENLDALAFLRQLNEVAHARHPGTQIVAEESTAWPGVSRPVWTGGLGFTFKWNMGWMHDTLAYFAHDPIHRRHHHGKLSFGLLYAWSENYLLPLSHDEVVHGKRSLIDKMPGDRWQKFANLRALYGHMWAHPGKKLLFMGGEFGQWREWSHERSLDWHLLAEADHAGLQALVRDLNRAYRAEPALWAADTEPEGFQWLEVDAADDNVVAYLRRDPASGRALVCVGNFSPVVHRAYRLGLPRPGRYRELINSDAAIYGGSNVGNGGEILATPVPWKGQPCSAEMVLPPLAVIWLQLPD